MTDMNRPASHNRDAGFTMIEIVVVLVLATVMTTIAVTGSMRAWNGYRLRSSCQTLATKITEARTQALKQSRAVWVLLDSADNSIQVQTNGPAGVQNIGGRTFLAQNIRFMGFGGTRTLAFDLMGRPALAPDFVMVALGPANFLTVNVNNAGRITIN